jgi:hypothetical protein
VEALRRSLIEAEQEAERDGWIPAKDFLTEIDAAATVFDQKA